MEEQLEVKSKTCLRGPLVFVQLALQARPRWPTEDLLQWPRMSPSSSCSCPSTHHLPKPRPLIHRLLRQSSINPELNTGPLLILFFSQELSVVFLCWFFFPVVFQLQICCCETASGKAGWEALKLHPASTVLLTTTDDASRSISVGISRWNPARTLNIKHPK